MAPPDKLPNHAPATSHNLPRAPIDRWLRPVARFFKIEAASGIVLVACTIAALVLTNSAWGHQFEAFWETPLVIAIGNFELKHSLVEWINDGLMVIFFFVVGLEIKWELVAGELTDPRKAALPAVAALGGMVAPAAIYLLIEASEPARTGWGVPVATDIAFVVGCMVLLGPRVPPGVKILLLTLAIVDDIGAVLVIAIFYAGNISLAALALAAMGFGVVYLFNRIGVRSIAIYVLLGIGIWLAFHKAGVHPTVAGVILGLMAPTRALVDRAQLKAAAYQPLHPEEGGHVAELDHKQLLQLAWAAKESIPPLERIEDALQPWVLFAIMPLFALANAGVRLEAAAMTSSVALAVVAGLVVGKPLGIVLFSLGAVKLGWARMPSGVNWNTMIGAGCLGGIGFTMSLFIAGLAFQGEPFELEAGKVGTLVGSAISAVVGSTWLIVAARKAKRMPAKK